MIAEINRSRAPTNTSTSARHSAPDSGTPPTTNPDTAASTPATNSHDDTPSPDTGAPSGVDAHVDRSEPLARSPPDS
ncbi:hypothetical protein Pmi06nite_13740 [Planotetraspora mira]|uniref:Uncharacterized protein n=1 Tax=Planotetraspora mira TaxID=58121 RepID=A0A8J3TLF0_9ACTN|nr:hypothetical protein Pmi06nite_13740 [Planotetraspora mira]